MLQLGITYSTVTVYYLKHSAINYCSRVLLFTAVEYYLYLVKPGIIAAMYYLLRLCSNYCDHVLNFLSNHVAISHVLYMETIREIILIISCYLAL